MVELLERVDTVRLDVSRRTERKHKSALGQFMTPTGIARFMASLFPRNNRDNCRLLDAGAGIGSLSSAFLDRCGSDGFNFIQTEVDVFEVDEALHDHLAETLALHATRLPMSYRINAGDFIEHAVNSTGLWGTTRNYTHAILNPPYKKIGSHSRHRLLLRQAGIETVNLYSAFVALALAQLEDGGHLVAIVPRSFCNGPYYRPFREWLLARAAIHHMHLFASRNQAFRDDEVLQENVILLLERGGKQGVVTISTSTDDGFTDLVENVHPFERIVFPDDTERFIHVPESAEPDAIALSPAIRHSLADLGIEVSTGPVVDFRLRDFLRTMPEVGSVPLLYPNHFANGRTEWPKVGAKKPNAIVRNEETDKWLFPTGCYTVVRRFSAKEEVRRIVANVVDPADFPGHHSLGFENHLNVFHHAKHGLSEILARGLAVYLNASVVDDHFRRFNGHTQVNATDLRRMRYPSQEALHTLGQWAIRKFPTQTEIDQKVEEIIT